MESVCIGEQFGEDFIGVLDRVTPRPRGRSIEQSVCGVVVQLTAYIRAIASRPCQQLFCRICPLTEFGVVIHIHRHRAGHQIGWLEGGSWINTRWAAKIRGFQGKIKELSHLSIPFNILCSFMMRGWGKSWIIEIGVEISDDFLTKNKSAFLSMALSMLFSLISLDWLAALSCRMPAIHSLSTCPFL